MSSAHFSLHEIIHAKAYRLKFSILNDGKDWLLVLVFSNIQELVFLQFCLLT